MPNMHLPYDLALHWACNYIHTKTWTRMFTEALLTKAKPETKLSFNKYMVKLWYIHTIEYYSVMKRSELLIHTVTWMGFKNIMLTEGGLASSVRTSCLVKKKKSQKNDTLYYSIYITFSESWNYRAKLVVAGERISGC